MKRKRSDRNEKSSQQKMSNGKSERKAEIPIRLTSDLVFKAVFGRDQQECRDALISLLNAVLRESTHRSGLDYDDPINELEYVNPFNLQEHAGEKLSCMDIVVRTKHGERIDIEMQVRKQDFLPKRSLYYGARQLMETLDAGDNFAELKKCVVISIVVGSMFEDTKQFHHIYRLKEIGRGVELTDTLELQYIELAKLDLNKPVTEMTELERWGAYLRSAGEPRLSPLVQRLKGQNGGIEMAETVRIKVSEDEHLRTKAMLEDKFQRTILSEMYEAKQKGLEEGREKGLEKGLQEGLTSVAQNMLREGLSLEIVQKVTGIELSQLTEWIEDSAAKK